MTVASNWKPVERKLRKCKNKTCLTQQSCQLKQPLFKKRSQTSIKIKNKVEKD